MQSLKVLFLCMFSSLAKSLPTSFRIGLRSSAGISLSRMSTGSTSTEVQIASGIRDIVDQYDTFLLDMWGVMHDGTRTYEGVIEAVQKLKENGKELIILSNSSKRRCSSIKMLTKLGFDPAKDFSEIITSGEVAYHLLAQSMSETSLLAPKPWNVLESIIKNNQGQKNVFCFGSGEGDAEYLESCGWTLSPVEEADLIVARGTFTIDDGSTFIHKTDDGEEAYFQAYQEQLAKAAERNIPMIIANPDKIRPDADRSPMPGTIGTDYEKILKSKSDPPSAESIVKYIGKPFDDVYEIALRGKDRSRVCMVGDALETDITGGSAFGIDTIWVIKDGVHNVDVESRGMGSLEIGCHAVLESFNQLSETYANGRQLSPSVVVPHFRW